MQKLVNFLISIKGIVIFLDIVVKLRQFKNAGKVNYKETTYPSSCVFVHLVIWFLRNNVNTTQYQTAEVSQYYAMPISAEQHGQQNSAK